MRKEFHEGAYIAPVKMFVTKQFTFLLCAGAICGSVQKSWAADYDPGPPFNQYKSEAPPYGYNKSACGTDLEDLPGSPTHGPIEYSCRSTELAHLQKPGKDQIRKFIGIACRNGSTESLAKFKASAEAHRLVFQAELDEKEKLGGAPESNEIFVTNKRDTHCVRLPDDSTATQNQADEAPSPVPPSPAPASHPGQAIFTLRSDDSFPLGVKFFSQNRNQSWSGKELNTKETYILNCSRGEKICFGAWRDNQTTYWGVGHGKDGCKNCCITCGGELDTTLNDGGPATDPPRDPNTATFILHNQDRYRLGVEFYSQNRANFSWPGNNQQYNLSTDRTYNLTCNIGEKICFGAWRDYHNTYWGVGHGKEGCSKCCVTCGGSIETTLNDAGPDTDTGSGVGSTTHTVLDVAGAILNGLGGVGNVGRGGSSGPPVHFPPAPRAPQSDITGIRRH